MHCAGLVTNGTKGQPAPFAANNGDPWVKYADRPDGGSAVAARAALVVSPEITSGHLDWKDRDCHFIFGDVCTAVLVERAEDTRSADAWRVLGTKCATSFSNNIRNNAGYLSRSEDRNPDDRDQLFRQEGRKVFKEVCPMAAEHIAGHLQQLGHARPTFAASGCIRPTWR